MKGRDAGLIVQIEEEVLSGRPLADGLRKCIMLGGRSRSTALREWASRELRGYRADDDVPDYRTAAAGIFVDAFVGNGIVRGQRISAWDLPDFVRETITETVTFRQGIGEIEAMAETASQKGAVKLSLPMAADLGRLMDHASGNPWQHIDALYWSVSSVALRSIVDQVRTTLTELVAEIRAGMTDDQQVPSAHVADQAVNVAVHGRRSQVTVTTALSEGGSPTTIAPYQEPESHFWTRSRKLGALVVGSATVASLGVAIAQWQGW